MKISVTGPRGCGKTSTALFIAEKLRNLGCLVEMVGESEDRTAWLNEVHAAGFKWPYKPFPNPREVVVSDAIGSHATELDCALDPIADEIPEGFEIRIAIGLHSGTVELIGPEGEAIDFASNHESFGQEIRDAIEHARNGAY